MTFQGSREYAVKPEATTLREHSVVKDDCEHVLYYVHNVVGHGVRVHDLDTLELLAVTHRFELVVHDREVHDRQHDGVEPDAQEDEPLEVAVGGDSDAPSADAVISRQPKQGPVSADPDRLRGRLGRRVLSVGWQNHPDPRSARHRYL
ncbi:hypothetical protein ON010_g13227 [Phytophthora cinnamomi]|nr:hypothetical protein ON010_g13227 [Phytophthora cinnamomi]